MYQSTYELEKLAEMKHKEFLERAEKSRISRFTRLRKREPRPSSALSSYLIKKPVCSDGL